MAIYRFKVSFENYDDVWREIDIRSDQTFEDFFYAIQQSIGFDNKHDASFYISNDQWKLGQRISSVTDNNAIALKDAVMHDWVNDPHQKIYYTYDSKSDWSFYIELVRILMKEDLSVSYPACVKVYGDSPAQYIRQPSPAIQDTDAADKLLNDILKGIHDDEEAMPEDYDAEDTDEDEEIVSEEVSEDDGYTSADDDDSENEQHPDEDDEQREY